MASPLDDHRLGYLYEAVRLGSVRAAADHLSVNASVVSRQIAQLEKDLGVLLIERLGRGVRATEAGELLAQRFRQWSADRADTLAKLQEIQGLKRGHVDIVTGEGFISDLMSGPLARFWERHPSLTLSVEVAGTNDVIRGVAEDRYHVGLVYNAPPDPRLRTAAASRQPICLVAAPDHPLALRGGPVPLREAAAHPVAHLHARYGVRQIVAMAEMADRVSLPAALTTGSIQVVREFAKTGRGITFLPAFAAAADVAAGTLVTMPLDSPLLTKVEAKVITRLGRQLPSAAAQLLRVLIAQMKAFHAGAPAEA
ncbi:LysR family transcriptional regulator [Azorhizobium oxalatiphilum]|uniref:LysR family transcriptional regulator n=1 Tax=Azorhizobium oxalatiphilum TaxID=980631 RepID=A0A917BW62_9HYPH|nr:LysR family transcriptional regulator [Azorhizobium oxalatiphilum]GGF56947.1 LysR family transcriptional regulator [Azorhizobium oxalatiphilum]